MASFGAIGEYPLSAAPVGGGGIAADTRLQPLLIAPPQQTSARELIGYGAIFAAAAALLQPLDAIGATNYTVGTQNAAIAEAQPHGKVWGTPPSLYAVQLDEIIGRTFTAAPQLFDDSSAAVYCTAPPSFDRPTPRLFVVVPQFYDDSSAAVYGTQPDGIDVPQPRTLFAIEQAYEAGSALLFGREPEVAPVVSVAITTTRVAAPEQVDFPAAHVFGTQPESVVLGDVGIAATRIAAPEQVEFPAAQLWGPQPAPLVIGTDTIGPANYSVGHQNVEISTGYHAGRLWGTPDILIEPPVPAIRQPYTRVAAPEQIDLPSASVFATPTPLMPIAAVVPGREHPLLFAAPPQIEIGDTWYWGTTVANAPVPPTRIAAAPQVPDLSRAEVWGPTPQTAAVVPSHAVLAVPQTVDRTDSFLHQLPTQLILEKAVEPQQRLVVAIPQYDIAGTALVFGQQPLTADPLIGHTLGAGQYETDGAAYVFGQQPESVEPDSPIGHTLTAAQFEIDGVAFVFGTPPQLTPARRDKPIGHTLSAGQFEVDGFAALFGPQPVSAEPLYLRQIVAGQYEIDGSATLFGRQPESASTLILRPVIAGQYLTDGHALLWREPSLAAVVPKLTEVHIYVEALIDLQFDVQSTQIDIDFQVEKTLDIRTKVRI